MRLKLSAFWLWPLLALPGVAVTMSLITATDASAAHDALAHTILYLVDLGAVQKVMADLPKLYIWTGWIAFVIFVPLAITSSDYFMRKMGRSWKTLQRTTCAAAVLTLLHWAALHDWGGLPGALVHFVPLSLLESYRLSYWYLRPRPRRLSVTRQPAAISKPAGCDRRSGRGPVSTAGRLAGCVIGQCPR